jgi:hypothetical protein
VSLLFGKEENKMKKGFIGEGLLFILALIGVWAVYHWYRTETLKENLYLMANDYKRAVMSVVTDPQDREKINQAMEQIEEVLKKYRR